MTTRKAAIAFVMDPIEKVDIGADTSFALMLEAQRRGHRVYYAAPEDLGIDAGRETARVQRAKPRREAGRHPGLEPARGNPGGQREPLCPPLPRADAGHLRAPGPAEADRLHEGDGRGDDREAPPRQGRGGNLPRPPGRPESLLDPRAVDPLRG